MTDQNLSALSKQGLSVLEHYIEKSGLPIQRGIEKEGLRSTSEFDIAQTNHPEKLGHPLTHAGITTDYSEALLELITPVKNSREALLTELESIHRYVNQHSGSETLWAGSMPCRLDGEESIRIAEYGDSNIGQLKHVYRQGLGVRYGRVMQSIAGLHFNFSLSDAFWTDLHAATTESNQSNNVDHASLQTFKSERYFALIRNFRRHAWLLMYLFGASPALDKSFVKGSQHQLDSFDGKGTLYKPYATSLRMGDLGYHNNAQEALAICFNTLDNFTHTLGQAIHTPYAPYQDIGIKHEEQYIQLNTNILQIENEYYSSIRPKRTTHSGEKPTQALIERGVEYIEVRCLDLNPTLPLGIDETEVDFLDIFLLHSLMTPSAFIDDDACKELEDNFTKTVNDGRNPALTLQNGAESLSIKDWGIRLIEDMTSIAKALDKANHDDRYQLALQHQKEKLLNVDLTPSAKVLQAMQESSRSWLEYAGQLSSQHKASLSLTTENETKVNTSNTSTPPSPPSMKPSLSEIEARFDKEASDSFTAAQRILDADSISFDRYLDDYHRS